MVQTRGELVEIVARAIAPEDWAQYDAGYGTCALSTGFGCVDSIHAARRVVDTLERRAYPVPPD